jgi:hypothetical protein
MISDFALELCIFGKNAVHLFCTAQNARSLRVSGTPG